MSPLYAQERCTHIGKVQARQSTLRKERVEEGEREDVDGAIVAAIEAQPLLADGTVFSHVLAARTPKFCVPGMQPYLLTVRSLLTS